ncbi:D-alanyl-D-alanine carboxypeptidase/D-alanyl-D-alanine endopeptidase [Streptomyces tateyamensis]|nr:D-alanyl-D-alanine carboxypeptidase/D-alanyl-D-alanine-endopeptidase [Streptomyces tateyamensis]
MSRMIRGRLHAWAAAAAAVLVVTATTAAAPGAAPQDELPPDIAAIMHKAPYDHAQWGLLEIDTSTGRTVHSQFADQFFTAGSTTKLVTLSAAWHTVGPDHRFTTPLQAVGTRNGSTLTGNLALVAQGDLTMGGRTRPDGTVDYVPLDHTYANDLPGATLTPEDPLAGLDQIAQQVRDAGITEVDGDVVIDPRLFTPPALDPQPTPMIINDNVIDLLSTPTTQGQPAQLSWRPQVAPYQVTSTVITGAPGSPTDISVSASPDGTRISLSGSIAADAKPALKISQVRDPNAFGRTALIEALARAGVTVTAPSTGSNPDAKLPASYDGDQQVAAYVSPPYQQYAKLVLKVSHNLGANLALCLMATARGSHDCNDGFGIEREFLAGTANVDPGQFQLVDGRGVAEDKVTPTGISQILTYWLHSPEAEAFRFALPILGVDGTGALSCTHDCPAKGKVFAKPGTVIGLDDLNQRLTVGAQGLGGYLETDDGCLHIFYVMVNGASTPDIPGYLDINEDVNTIAALLQEHASADRSHP